MKKRRDIPRKHLTISERKVISRSLNKGLSITDIASHLNRAKKTIRREIKRNGGHSFYDPQKAQERANSKKNGWKFIFKKYAKKYLSELS